MNAKIARELAIQNSQSEIDSIIIQIEYSTGLGKMKIKVANLKPATISYLEDNGYDITQEKGYYIISWK